MDNDVKIKWLARMGEAAFGSNWKSELSRQFDVNERTVRSWASGERTIPSSIIRSLVTYLNVRANSLINTASTIAYEAEEYDEYERVLYLTMQPDSPVRYGLRNDQWRWFDIDGIFYGLSDTGIIVNVKGDDVELPAGLRIEHLNAAHEKWISEH